MGLCNSLSQNNYNISDDIGDDIVAVEDTRPDQIPTEEEISTRADLSATKRTKRAKELEKYSLIPAYCIGDIGCLSEQTRQKYRADWPPGTEWATVSNPSDIEQLWFGGCFGRGLLSRSQPVFMITKAAANAVESEQLLLCPLEMIFLSWALQCLDVYAVLDADADAVLLTAVELWQTLACLSLPNEMHTVESCSLTTKPGTFRLDIRTLVKQVQQRRPVVNELLLANDFIIKYVAYHYYRSKQWVVRRGIKYGCDFVLYRRGPVFNHAGQAVLVVADRADAKLNWFDLLTHVRVLGNVRKEFLLCYVSMTMMDASADLNSVIDQIYTDPCNALRYFKVQEVQLNRWVPQKARESLMII